MEQQKLEALKLEYGFISAHLRDLVNVRFAYFAAYLTASGLYFYDERTFPHLLAYIAFTVILWGIEIRTRIIIRACTRRISSIERDEFKYTDGFFVSQHPLHDISGKHKPQKGTIKGIKELIVLNFILASIVNILVSAYVSFYKIITRSEINNSHLRFRRFRKSTNMNKYFRYRYVDSDNFIIDYAPIMDSLFSLALFLATSMMIAPYLLNIFVIAFKSLLVPLRLLFA